MKITIDQRALAQAMTLLSRLAANTKSVMIPSIRISVNGGHATLSTTNGEEWLDISGEDPSAKDGEFFVQVKTLKELAACLPAGEVTLEEAKTSNGSVLHVRWSTGEAVIPASGDDEHLPKPAGDDKSVTVKINAASLARSIKQGLFAASDEPLRPALNALRLEFSPEGKARTVTTNATVLMMKDTAQSESPDGDVVCFVRKPVAASIAAILDGADEDADVTFNGRAITISVGDIVYTASTMEVKYPPYQEILKKEGTNILEFRKDDFAGALRRVCAGSYIKDSLAVTLNITPGLPKASVEVTAEDIYQNIKSKETIEAGYIGVPMVINFKAIILMETLASFSCDSIRLTLDSERTPAFIRPAGDAAVPGDQTAFIMPCFIKK